MRKTNILLSPLGLRTSTLRISTYQRTSTAFGHAPIGRECHPGRRGQRECRRLRQGRWGRHHHQKRWGHHRRHHHPLRRGQVPWRVQSSAAQSAALSAAHWAADRAHSPARQLAPRPAPLSLRKRKHGLADIIGGAAPVITAIRTVPGRRQWARIIAATELIVADRAKPLRQVAGAFINPAEVLASRRAVDELRSHGECCGAQRRLGCERSEGCSAKPMFA
jgi:hypothetical protein